MINFCQYYVDFLRTFLGNIGDFFVTIFKKIYEFFIIDLKDYFVSMFEWSNKFGFFDWLCYIVLFTLNIGLVALAVVLLINVRKRRKRFKKQQKSKEELLQEIEELNNKIDELANEKNQIFAMKLDNLQGKNRSAFEIGDEDEDSEKPVVHKDSRFTKLINVDEKYQYQIEVVNMNPDDMVSLPQLVDRFINFSANQLHLYYDRKTIAQFFAGMATSKVMILEGISGTGKTSLPYAMGKFFKNDTAIISVQPSWRDRAEIIGYLNEFTKKFNETDFLKALYETTYRNDMNFIVLDEMNLARIEYYFAEFLSIMEMPDPSEWKIDLVPDSQDSDPKNFINGKILVPQNVWFVGTANRDDSTFTITDKVYDRASVIEMNNRANFIDAPFTPAINMTYDYINNLFTNAIKEYAMSSKSLENVQKVDRFIVSNFKITFGNRIMKQLKLYVPVYVACGFSEVAAIDFFISRKILRKFETLNLAFLHKELEALIDFLDRLYGKGACEECIAFARDLIKNS